jgi:translation initiation factor IF-3
VGGSTPTEGFAIATYAKDQTRVNSRIRVPQVRVIGDDGEQIGIIATSEALAMAQDRGLDLVEVAATSRPPVCRIMDYGKYKYEQAKRDRSARKKQHIMHLKEVKLRPKIEEHDYVTKLDRARRFLNERDKVKFTVLFRGREMAYPERGRNILKRVIEELAEIAAPEHMMRHEGRTVTVTLLPKPAKQAPPKQPVKQQEKAPAESPDAPKMDAGEKAPSSG